MHIYKCQDEAWCPVPSAHSEFTKKIALNVALNIRHLFKQYSSWGRRCRLWVSSLILKDEEESQSWGGRDGRREEDREDIKNGVMLMKIQREGPKSSACLKHDNLKKSIRLGLRP